MGCSPPARSTETTTDINSNDVRMEHLPGPFCSFCSNNSCSDYFLIHSLTQSTALSVLPFGRKWLHAKQNRKGMEPGTGRVERRIRCSHSSKKYLFLTKIGKVLAFRSFATIWSMKLENIVLQTGSIPFIFSTNSSKRTSKAVFCDMEVLAIFMSIEIAKTARKERYNKWGHESVHFSVLIIRLWETQGTYLPLLFR